MPDETHNICILKQTDFYYQNFSPSCASKKGLLKVMTFIHHTKKNIWRRKCVGSFSHVIIQISREALHQLIFYQSLLTISRLLLTNTPARTNFVANMQILQLFYSKDDFRDKIKMDTLETVRKQCCPSRWFFLYPCLLSFEKWPFCKVVKSLYFPFDLSDYSWL